MNHHLLRLFFVLLLLPLMAACDLESDDPDPHHPDIGASSPASIEGSWILESMTDKTGEFFGQSGRSATAGQAVTYTVSDGSQSFTTTFLINGNVTFSSDRYTVQLDIAFSITGLGAGSDTTLDTGSYTVTGSTLTITSDNPEPDDTNPTILTWSITDGDLILEDEETRMRFSK